MESITILIIYIKSVSNRLIVSQRNFFEEFGKDSIYNIWLFYLIAEAATKGLLCKKGVLAVSAKPLKKSLYLVKLQTVGYNLFKNEFLYRYVLTVFVKFQ